MKKPERVASPNKGSHLVLLRAEMQVGGGRGSAIETGTGRSRQPRMWLNGHGQPSAGSPGSG